MSHRNKPQNQQNKSTSNASPIIPATPKQGASGDQGNSESKFKPSQCNYEPPRHEKRAWGLTRFEGIMSLLTFLAVLVTGLTARYIHSQRDDSRKDQRPWVRVWINALAVQNDSSELTIGQHILNSGKTPAKNMDAYFSLEKVINGNEPTLSNDHRYAHDILGIGFPNIPFDDKSAAYHFKPGEAEEFITGKSFFVVYGTLTYTDVFNTQHWTNFCQPIINPPGQFTYKSYIQYNNTDDN